MPVMLSTARQSFSMLSPASTAIPFPRETRPVSSSGCFSAHSPVTAKVTQTPFSFNTRAISSIAEASQSTIHWIETLFSSCPL